VAAVAGKVLLMSDCRRPVDVANCVGVACALMQKPLGVLAVRTCLREAPAQPAAPRNSQLVITPVLAN